jgi:antitoxin (DNA-binding transcriptional repressor) of toxin-antitoxin stability system
MVTRRIGISEARRLLPELVKVIAKDGGRIDITYRGEPRVSLLRVSDVRGSRPSPASARGLPPALQVELIMPADDLVDAIAELRGRQGQPRTAWLAPGKVRPRKSAPPGKSRCR